MTDYPRYLAAIGIALGLISTALPDTVVGSPRSIAQAVGMAFIGAAVYLGAPKPDTAATR